MPLYKYEVMSRDGKKKSDTIEAKDIESARQELKDAGNFIVSISATSALNRDINISIGKPVKTRELSVFCRQFQSLIEAGVPVMDGLDMLAEQTTNKMFKAAISDVRENVGKGSTLSEAMSMNKRIFPEIMIHMVAAGEVTGSLDVAFDRLGKQFEKDSHVQGMVAKAMVYPVILILVIIAVVIIMMVKIVPTFTSSFDEVGAKLPFITRAVMAVSDFIIGYWWIMVLAVVGIVIAIKQFKKTERGAIIWGKLGIKLPLFGNLTIKSASARLCSTLATLMASGITMVDAIAVVERLMTNEVVKQAMKHTRKEVEMGTPVSIPIEASGVFPPMVYHMMRIGEETGQMEEMLDKVSVYYDEEVEMATQSLMAALEPMIIILMALVVVPIILAVMMPMYSLYDAI